MRYPPNLCDADRYVRGVVSLVCFYFSTLGSDWIGQPIVEGGLFVFAAVNLLSFVTRWCPVYHIAGVSTCRTNFK